MKVRSIARVALGFFASWLPMLAHHSFSAEYDASKPIKVNGVVTKVEWLNPHVWFYVDEKDENGNIIHWAFSGGAPGQLMRRGIYKTALPIGSTVNVEGFRAKDGSNNGNGNKVTFPDGRMVFTASQEPGEKGGDK
jgi:hypothetical protein